MFIRRLYLHNFRNIEEADIAFCPGINMIYGDNAQGKTTVLEAIHLLMTGRSFRTMQVSDLIRHGASSFYLEIDFVKHDIEQKIKVSASSKERQIMYNNTRCPTVASLLGILQGVLITPDDNELVKGSPLIRRQFLDMQLAQVDPLYVHYVTRYHRAMSQRNQLLRSKNVVSIESWEYEMANAGAYVITQRRKVSEDLHQNGQVIHHQMNAEHEELGVHYKTTAPVALDSETLRHYYLEQFTKLRRRELELGSTLTGPHRDDLMIAINRKDTRVFASEGQQRSCVAAIRFAEWERLQRLSGECPLMMIDDVGMSLDEKRKQKLWQRLATQGQVFLTSAQETLGSIAGEINYLHLANGKLVF